MSSEGPSAEKELPQGGSEGEGSASGTEKQKEGEVVDAVFDEVQAKPEASGKRLTAGARLAALKAAKAAAKRAKKEARKAQEAAKMGIQERPKEEKPVPEADSLEEVLQESEIGRAVLSTQGFFEKHKRAILWALGAMGLVALGLVVWGVISERGASERGRALKEGLEISRALVSDKPLIDSEGKEKKEKRFASEKERDEAALAAFEALSKAQEGTLAGLIAELGAGRAALGLSRYEEAKEHFERAIRASNKRFQTLERMALEGLGAAEEAMGHWDEAKAAYERLSEIHGKAFEAVARYHLARLELVRGEKQKAQASLQSLLDELRKKDLERNKWEPEFSYVRAQAELRLREFNPLAGGGAAEFEIEELIRRLREKQESKGEGE
ncbi:MAG: hypothetical protein NZM37_00565 [Sandaracinaceae bacterium]|nr:hypothetical protein [Sandaracinaceae bacterium]MDW8247606.1 hypothetical protein [Sandaracinaceae bacterium]